MSGLAVSSQWDEAITHYETAAKIAIEVLDQFYDAPERTLLNLNVPNLPTAELKGVRRGRISNAGIIKARSSEGSGFTLGESGEIPLRFGAATPQLGDVSDEMADEDGALIAAGYASLTPIVGPREFFDEEVAAVMASTLRHADEHLASLA
jgi:broad specificity polyphosphatase/5'/3'-nucleotidase SurE